MIFKYREFIIFFISLLILIFFFYFSISVIKNKPFEIINFIDSEIHEDFEIDIADNLNELNDYLKEYLFIDNYLLKREKNELNIIIKLKKSFAINNFTKEVIFYDNTIAPLSFFKSSYLNSIVLTDISKNSIYINKYLNENFNTLSSLFSIEQIEYIDERRYNLVLRDGRIIMLPKVIDNKLLYFIKNNIDLINKSTNYSQFIDLRNFHNKTIRLK